MDFIAKLDTFFKVRNIYKTAKKVHLLHATAKKLDAKKQPRVSDLAIFKNKDLQEMQKNAYEAIKETGKLIGMKVEWPSGAFTASVAAAAAHKKYGAESKKYAAARAKRDKLMKDNNQTLRMKITTMERNQKELTERLKLTSDLSKMLLGAQKICRTLMDLPSFTGTVQQTKLFQMGEQCSKLSGSFSTLTKNQETLIKQNKKFMSEGKTFLKENEVWIKEFKEEKLQEGKK
ncbi:hypothetical protein [Pseudopelagicola sp. nBUS_19]|uniref:hypothetical protein n=1 Tax=Pseudopelagicola sp. nBUS_19 TaxID=3395316 RepID=UPI003EC10E4E